VCGYLNASLPLQSGCLSWVASSGARRLDAIGDVGPDAQPIRAADAREAASFFAGSVPARR
jgi:hypothetical protein